MNQTTNKHEFQAEVKQLLDIVIHSLYTDKEIFVRELTSNAADALEKLRHVQLTEKDVFDDHLDLEINITTNDSNGTLTIQDFGIGMTEAELIENLGTIAHSGSKAFLEAIKSTGNSNENLIGQFGVGFYSAFMVAKEVKVYTRSWQPNAPSYCWSSDGSGTYSIEETEGERRGCKVVVHLKEEYKEFASESRIKSILEHYSNYVPFSLNLNGTKINTIDAIWLKNKNAISEDNYKEFYKFQAKAFDEPLDWLHFSADAPLSIHALLFIPSTNLEQIGMSQLEPSIALHCRKILIDPHPKNLLPKWLRFLKGVVDSADLPLNISRESMQDTALIQKLNRILTKKFIKHVETLAIKNPEKYQTFWKHFSPFIKEGITSDFAYKENLSKLLRFESSLNEKNDLTSLDEYLTRMPAEQNEIYYIVGQNRTVLENSPFMEAFKARNIEVLYLYDGIDDFVMSHLDTYENKKLVSIESENVDLKNLDEKENEDGNEPLDEASLKELCNWLKKTLGEDNVSEVSQSKRLVNSPLIAINSDKSMTTHMRRMFKIMHRENDLPSIRVHLQINPNHNLIKKLASYYKTQEKTATLIALHIFETALMQAGLLENPQQMLSRTYQLLEKIC